MASSNALPPASLPTGTLPIQSPASPHSPTPPTPPRTRWWRRPADEPRYVRPALLGILAAAAILYAWGITNSPFHSFYADAARSMSQSWKAFFFGSFDPANSITLDKLPGFLWPQALSARIFGFHSWALTLPQVLEGIASVLVLYLLVKRWLGVNAGLLAAGVFLFIPAADGLFRTQTEDPLFTLCVLLAALFTQKAAQTGRLRSLIWAAVWVGLGFQAKMLEAWAILPALAVLYLIMAPAPLRKRFLHVGLAGVVTVAVSSIWVVAVSLTPAQDRPYVDGTTDNSAFSMVVGYNFLNRFSSVGLSASGTGSISATQGGGRGGARPAPDTSTHDAGQSPSSSGFRGGGTQEGGGGQGGGSVASSLSGEDGVGKMLGPSLASQTGWLYPIAAIAVLCGLLWRRREPRTDVIRGGFILLGAWLATFFAVFSVGSVTGHIYYMGVVAVPSAALAGGGLVYLWREYRTQPARVWALPTAVGTTALWGAWIASQLAGVGLWLSPLVVMLGFAAVLTLLLGRPRTGTASHPRTRRLALAGMVTGLLAMLVAPATWAAGVFEPGESTGQGAVGPTLTGRGAFSTADGANRDGTAAFRDVGSNGSFSADDAGTRGRGTRTEGGGSQGGSQDRGGAPGLFAGMFGAGTGGNSMKLSGSQQRILDYTQAHKGTATYDFAVTAWNTASPYILDDGASVLAMGGFSGRVPFPTLEGFQQLVNSGAVKFVLLPGAGGTATNATATAEGTRGNGSGQGGRGGISGTTTAAVTSWVSQHCTAVPTSDYSASASSTQTLYQCAPAS